MRKQSFFRSMSLVFLALAVFFIGSHPSSYAADVKDKNVVKANQDENVVKANQYVKAGMEAEKKSDTDKAIESFNQAVSVDPKDPRSYVGLGNAYGQKGDVDKAVEFYNKAISLDPKNAYAHSGLGNIYLTKGDKDAALKQYKILSDLDKKIAEQLDKRIQASTPKNPK